MITIIMFIKRISSTQMVYRLSLTISKKILMLTLLWAVLYSQLVTIKMLCLISNVVFIGLILNYKLFLGKFSFNKHTILYKNLILRFYFAFSLSKQVDLIDSNIKVIFYFLLSGLQLYLNNLIQNLNKNDVIYSENYYSVFNIEFLEAFLIIGKLKKMYPNSYETISAHDSFK